MEWLSELPSWIWILTSLLTSGWIACKVSLKGSFEGEDLAFIVYWLGLVAIIIVPQIWRDPPRIVVIAPVAMEKAEEERIRMQCMMEAMDRTATEGGPVLLRYNQACLVQHGFVLKER